MRTDNFKVRWFRNGNITTCKIQREQEEESLVEGVAKKHIDDQPNKKISRLVSFKRAMNHAIENALLTKEERKEIWNTFRNTINQPSKSFRLPEEV